MGDEGAQIERLRQVLHQCHLQGVSILILPELRVPPNLLGTVMDFLRQQSCNVDRGLLVVVAGSWHIRDDASGRWLNRSKVLDCRGDTIWVHDKLAEYNITPENVAASPSLRDRLGIDERGGMECISVGEDLQWSARPILASTSRCLT